MHHIDLLRAWCMECTLACINFAGFGDVVNTLKWQQWACAVQKRCHRHTTGGCKRLNLEKAFGHREHRDHRDHRGKPMCCKRISTHPKGE